MIEDAALLRRYAEDRREDAFAELVRRRLDLVYGVALRKVGGDAHLAQDVTQRVFTDLALKAAVLARHPSLTGWLFTSTHYAATQLVRAEQRRRAREEKAQAMNELLHDSAPAIDWERLRPLLDDLIRDLGERDREAVLLRFFERRPLAEIGAKLCLTEEGARSRVDRAVAKMRTMLARRGIASTNAALGVALANQISVAAPAGFAASVTSAALASTVATATMGGAMAAIGSFFTMSKINFGVASVLIAAGAVTAIREVRGSRVVRDEIKNLSVDRQEERRVRTENERLAAELAKVGEKNPDVAELTRLRTRIAQLQARPEGVAEPSMKPASAWRNAGRATLSDAYETIQWAQSAGDVNVFAEFITFAPRAKAKFDTFFANLPENARLKYGTVEKMVAASNPPRTDVVAYQITGQTESGIKVMVHAWTRDNSGRERKGDMLFQRYEDGWRAAPFTEEMADGIIASLDPLTGERLPKAR
jgi:RNA polymerase sigma factor (sigma-70 family)